jgi:hypothetical protein
MAQLERRRKDEDTNVCRTANNPTHSKERNEMTVRNLSEKLWKRNCITIEEVDVERDRTLVL